MSGRVVGEVLRAVLGEESLTQVELAREAARVDPAGRSEKTWVNRVSGWMTGSAVPTAADLAVLAGTGVSLAGVQRLRLALTTSTGQSSTSAESPAGGVGVAQTLYASGQSRPQMAGRDIHNHEHHHYGGGQVTGRGVFGVVPGRPVWWVDRAEVDRLVGVVACVGGRGVGKTTLAAAYTRLRVASSDGRPVVTAWLSGDTERTVVAGLARLAASLDLVDPKETDEERSAERARDYLNSLEEESLLVVDNAEEPETTWQWLPTIGRTLVLVTTTKRRFTHRAVEVGVGVYDRAQARTYLQDRTGLHDSAGAETVAEELADLPLGLAAAAAVITSQHLTYPDYVQKLRRRGLTDHLLPAPADYPRPLVTAITMQIETATAGASLARSLLETIAVLDPAGVSRDHLARHVRDADEDVDDLVGVLADESVISVSEDRASVLLHGVTAHVVRLAAADANRLDDVVRAAAQVMAELAQDTTDTLDHDTARELATHAASLLSLARTPATVNAGTVDAVSAAALLLCHAFDAAGWFGPMLTVAEAATALHADGAHQRNLLRSSDFLALALTRLGRTREAIAVGEEATARAVLPDADHDLQQMWLTLAAAYQFAGHLDQARDTCLRVLATRRAELGDQHLDTAYVRSKLASIYLTAEQPDKAIPLYESVLNVRRHQLGHDHVDTLSTRSSLAAAYEKSGRLSDAIENAAQALTGLRAILPADHWDVLATANNLAQVHLAAGDAAAAVALHTETVRTLTETYGPTDPFTLKATINLGRALRADGQIDAAARIVTEVVEVCQRSLSPGDPITLAAERDLAALRTEQGDR